MEIIFRSKASALEYSYGDNYLIKNYEIKIIIFITFIFLTCFWYFTEDRLSDIFVDTRSVITAQPIEKIQGKKAGSSIIKTTKSGIIKYTVQHGDSYWNIAERFNVDLHALMKHNRKRQLIPGMLIKIPRKMVKQ
ncbi:hypothetical protein GMMP15_90030 [Candidatus Magnetomoraceae bacterium gMMP-15]